MIFGLIFSIIVGSLVNVAIFNLVCGLYCIVYLVILPGIFAYLNYCTPKDRKYILDTLVNGLKRLEYRGYDSAGN